MRDAASYLELAEEAEAAAARVDWQANRRRYLELAEIWRRKAEELVPRRLGARSRDPAPSSP